MSSITNANLEWNESGTPVSEQFDDVYFSNVNGLEETRYVFLKQNHLPERWQTYDQRRFVIAETGFGTGLNFLAVWQWFEKFRAQNPDSEMRELHFISFEKFPLSIDDLKKAHDAWPELSDYAAKLQKHYPIAVPECHRIVLADGAVTLDLWFGDIKECLPLVPVPEEGIVDAWFLDGFAPSKNPEMWNQNLFDGMAKLAKQDCTCATFTAAGFVRRGLIEAGFSMKKVKGFGTKRDMIAGTLENRTAYTNMLPWYARPGVRTADDVAIIGGGIASAALAATLARRGVPVTIYCEDAEPAQNASSNRQGAVYPLLNGNHDGASRVFAPSFLFARQFFDQAAEKFDYDHDWCGVTHIGWSENADKKLNSILKGNFDPGLITPLTDEQMNHISGLQIDKPGVTYPLGGWMYPQQFTRKLLGELIDSGKVTLIYNTEITSLKQNSDNSWTLSSAESEFRHQSVVIANGYKADRFTQTSAIPQSPVKGQVSHIPTTPTLSHLKTVLCYNGYLTPVNPENGGHCIGASHDRQNIDTRFDSEAQTENLFKLQRALPDQKWVDEIDVSGNESNRGIRSASRDHLPFVGQVCDFEQVKNVYSDLNKKNAKENAPEIPSYENLYCLLALGGRGLCSAPLMAEVLASQICNDPLPLPADCLEAVHPGKMWVRKLLKGKAVEL